MPKDEDVLQLVSVSIVFLKYSLPPPPTSELASV